MATMNKTIISEQAINDYFDEAANRISKTAFQSAKERLLKDNEKEREQYLEVFRRDGEVKVRQPGMYWELIPVNKALQIRKRTGLSQAKFGETYGIPKRTIESWEMGERECPGYVMSLLERVVNEDFGQRRRVRVQKSAQKSQKRQ